MILEDSHGLLRIYRERHILRIIKYLRKLWKKKREGAIYLTGNSDYAENRRSLCIKIQFQKKFKRTMDPITKSKMLFFLKYSENKIRILEKEKHNV